MIEKKVATSRIDMNRDALFYDSRHDVISWGGYEFFSQALNEFRVASFISYFRRMDCFLDVWSVKIIDKVIRRWRILTVVTNIVHAPAVRIC